MRLRTALLLLVPPLALDAATLLFSSTIWTTRSSPGRSGQPGMTYASLTFMVAAICLLVLVLAPVVAGVRSRGMRAATEGEQTVAIYFVQAAALLLFWAWPIWIVSKFLFAKP